MPEARSLLDVLRNSLINSDLSFRDFVELALYHPEFGYYSCGQSSIGRDGDFITSPLLSPLFSDVLGNLIDEFLSRTGDAVSQVVDIGCGDGALIRALASIGVAGGVVGVWGVGGGEWEIQRSEIREIRDQEGDLRILLTHGRQARRDTLL
jgi:hypothetical protein